MTKKLIKIKLMNGINYQTAINEIFPCIRDRYDFVESPKPDYILFGPYGNDIPPKGDYIRIGYYCENFKPDLSICDWAFGVPYEHEINHPKYKRIEWHGFDPSSLVKRQIDIEEIVAKKTRFCNFLYSNRVPFREKFFQALSRYKPVDAPGKSMKNMPSIDTDRSGNIWQRKQNFLSEYKFTIAFENYSYPGYNTEKLLDPMIVNSLPIYFGNPEIYLHFNPNSFVNSHDYIKTNNSWLVNFLESSCQPDFKDVRPAIYNGFLDRLKRKSKEIGRDLKVKLKYKNFDNLIEKIIEIDRDDTLYANYLLEPWFYNNIPPSNAAVTDRWGEIFGN
jgi:alpha(1,3/1,4) fucosyltransferase